MSSDTQAATKEEKDEFFNCQRKGRRDACVDIECPCTKLKNEESAAENSNHLECCIHYKQSQDNSEEKEAEKT